MLVIMEKKQKQKTKVSILLKRFIKCYKEQIKYMLNTNYFKYIHPTTRKVKLNTAVSPLGSWSQYFNLPGILL